MNDRTVARTEGTAHGSIRLARLRPTFGGGFAAGTLATCPTIRTPICEALTRLSFLPQSRGQDGRTQAEEYHGPAKIRHSNSTRKENAFRNLSSAGPFATPQAAFPPNQQGIIMNEFLDNSKEKKSRPRWV